MTFVCTNVNLIACDLLQIVYAHTHTNVLSPVFIVYAHTHTNVLSPVFQCCSDKIWFVTQHCFNKNMFKKERKKVITKTVQICRQEHQTGQEGRKNNWKVGVVWGWGKIHIHMLVCFCLLVLKYHCFYLFPNTVQHTDRQTDTHTQFFLFSLKCSYPDDNDSPNWVEQTSSLAMYLQARWQIYSKWGLRTCVPCHFVASTKHFITLCLLIQKTKGKKKKKSLFS